MILVLRVGEDVDGLDFDACGKAGRADSFQHAVIRRVLHDIHAGLAVHVEQLGEFRALVGIDIGTGQHAGFGARMLVSLVVGQAAVDHGGAGLDIDAQVLAVRGHDPEPVGLGIEIHDQIVDRFQPLGDFRHTGGGAGRGVDGVDRAGCGDGIESEIGRADVDAEDLGVDPGDIERTGRAGLAVGHHEKLIVGGQPDQVESGCGRSPGDAACQSCRGHYS